MKRKEKFSVSLSKEVLESIRAAAKKESISVNAFIGRTLENFAIWDTHKPEFIPVRKALLAKLLDKFTTEEIDDIARGMALTQNKDTVLRLSSQFDLVATIKTFEGWLQMTGFPYSYDVEGTVHKFVLLHDLGLKWSIYLVKLLAGTMIQFDIFPKYDYTDKILSITIDTADFEKAEKATQEQIRTLSAALKEIEIKGS
ncbi:MAG TPA: hypothetical protein VJ792_00350 [Candidatus Nitrosotalea sp.]|nr:hypothetical protein [Candidatus Nitrosotalea sp.]